MRSTRLAVGTLVVLAACARSNAEDVDPVDAGGQSLDAGADARADGATTTTDSSSTSDAPGALDGAADATRDSSVVVGPDCSGLVPQPQAGLAAYYRFEETTGLVCDWSGNAHHGTLSGTGYTRAVAGAVGMALSFSGGTGAVVVPASAGLDFSTAATIELFLRVDSTGPVGGPLSRGTGNSDDNVLLDTSCGNVQLIFSRVGSTTNVTSACNLLTTATFQHIAMVNDGATLKLYLAGALVTSAAGGQMGPIASDLYIGRRQQGVFPLIGAVDEIRWWTIARTQAQVCADGGKVWSGTACN